MAYPSGGPPEVYPPPPPHDPAYPPPPPSYNPAYPPTVPSTLYPPLPPSYPSDPPSYPSDPPSYPLSSEPSPRLYGGPSDSSSVSQCTPTSSHGVTLDSKRSHKEKKKQKKKMKKMDKEKVGVHSLVKLLLSFRLKN